MYVDKHLIIKILHQIRKGKHMRNSVMKVCVLCGFVRVRLSWHSQYINRLTTKRAYIELETIQVISSNYIFIQIMSFLETYVSISSQKRHPNRPGQRHRQRRPIAHLFWLRSGSHERGQHIVLPSVAHPQPLSLAPEWSDPPGKLTVGWENGWKTIGEYDRVVNIAYMDCMGDGMRSLMKATHLHP